MKDWFRDLSNNVVASAISGLILLGTAAAAASCAVWGDEEANLPIWVVVLLGAVQVACVVAIVVLFMQFRGLSSTPQSSQ